MAKNQIVRFKTQLSNLTKGGKPCYSVRIINNGTEYLADSDQMKAIAHDINMSLPFAKSATDVVLTKAIELALSGYRVETDQLRMYLTARGGISESNMKWDSARNSLHLVVELKGELKAKMEELTLVNDTEGIKVSIYSVGDDIYAQDGVITGLANDVIKVACDNGKINKDHDDEGAWLLDRDGAIIAKLVVIATTEQTGDFKLPETVTPGEYQLMLAARNGENIDRAVGTAYKKLTVMGPKA